MCMMCIEINKGKITRQESIKGLYELLRFEEDNDKFTHYLELYIDLVRELEIDGEYDESKA